MRPSLQFKLGQQLTMTPQLQQSIRLLQLSTVDLQQEITEQLYSNPLLEIDDGNETASSTDDNSGIIASNSSHSEVTSDYQSDDTSADWASDIPQELDVDASWDDVVSVQPTQSASSPSSDFDFDRLESDGETLQDHLRWQLNLTQLSDIDIQIGEYIIDALDERGFLTLSLDELLPKLPDELVIGLDEIAAVLHQIQQFDPVGVAAQSLQECLSIQLKHQPLSTDDYTICATLINNHLEQLARLTTQELAKKVQCSAEQIDAAIALIRSLNPAPGASIQPNRIDYVTPDVRVRKVSDRWQVQLTDTLSTKLRINQYYSNMIQRGEGNSDNQFLKHHLQEARWFIRSLEARNDTLLRVSSAIVEAQYAFFDQGAIAMKPLILSDIAERLELHESTISRVTTQKYIDTPQGIFELKYFFSSHLATTGGGECSSTAVCAMLKAMIDKENPAKPLSDSKLVQLLEQQGVQVARRTVAKYRESMGVPSSSQRKRF